MLTYNEFIELKDKLTSGQISIKLAKEICWKDFKEGQRSWHTNDWKNRRAEFIKTKCEVCTSEDTLTLQHLSHPKKYSEYLTEITRESTKEFIASNICIDKISFENYIRDNYEYFPIPLCPNCNARNPNKRVRKLPQFLCTECRQEFDKTNHKPFDEIILFFYESEDSLEANEKCFVSKDKWKNKHSLSNIKYWFQRQEAKKADEDAIEKKAFLLYLEDNIKYLSFENAITACKKCASNFDLNRLDLCPKCKIFYKGLQFETCIQCLPEDKRKKVLELIEFGKQWKTMEKELGID